MPGGDVLGDLDGDAADQDAWRYLDHGHAGAAGNGARRDLEPDEAAADEDDALAGPKPGAEVKRVAVVAEIAERLAPRNRQPPRHGAGRKQQPVIGDCPAASEPDFVL